MREVFRDVDVDRAGPAVKGEVDRLLHHVAGLRRIRRAGTISWCVAANIACESGVRLTPEVSFSAPLPFQSSEAYPEIASTG